MKNPTEKLNNRNIMNKTTLIAADSSLGSGSYESPETKIEKIHSEGMLCMSMLLPCGVAFEEWEEDVLNW